ncbi:MAG TPA: fumarylacetoacetate hydrolase family protein [Candidatus Binataceae bacterium]|nr:fumarylacetoacetate hydrolase family protein [Candidatus Binataceae bacterium]
MAADAEFKLGTFAKGSGAPYAALVLDDTALELETVLQRLGLTTPQEHISVRSMLDHWEANFERLRGAANRVASDGLDKWREAAAKIDALRILPPVFPPGAVLQSAANYRTHVIQLTVAHRFKSLGITEGMTDEQVYAKAAAMMEERARNGLPFIFAGTPAAICGARDDVILPRRGAQHDWELELAVIIGRRTRNVSREQALDYVAGYTISNDLTTRDLVGRQDNVELGLDWIGSKNAPTFFPTGPFLVPRAFVPDPMNLQITLKLNGQTMQNESTADMIFDVRRLIEYTSSITVMEPGDMLLTGSPAGNGSHWKRFLKPGDVMESSITGLGVQINRCVAEGV